jgi:sphingolipid delta-4 desaturase
MSAATTTALAAARLPTTRSAKATKAAVTPSPPVSSAPSVSERSDEPDPAAAAANGDRDPQDFLWMYTEEPHRSRRMAILKHHPEVSAIWWAV